jgi:hypothetical protein
VEDLESASKIALLIYEPQDRRIAEAYFKCGCALGYANRRIEAKEYLNRAIQILRSRLAKLEQHQDHDLTKQELMDIQDLIPELESKVLQFHGNPMRFLRLTSIFFL